MYEYILQTTESLNSVLMYVGGLGFIGAMPYLVIEREVQQEELKIDEPFVQQVPDSDHGKKALTVIGRSTQPKRRLVISIRCEAAVLKKENTKKREH